jgi:glycosyltransferase involved in cell wall biosynthesis
MQVSIITPSFNQGQFIERTLKSVAMQRDSLPEDVKLTHIVYDGASTDNTTQILSSFKPEIRWFSEADDGQAHAVNKGLLNTDGDIIGWLNSDDIYYPDAIKKVVDFFNANPEIDVVYGMADHIDIFDKPFESYPTEVWNSERLKECCFICQPALFFRSNVLKKVGLLDESLNYCMDYEFWVRLACAGITFAYLEEKLAGSRMYEENKTLSSRIPVHKEINNMLKKSLGYVPMRPIINYAYAIVNEEIIKNDKPVKFAFRIFIVSTHASYIWNGGIIKFLRKALAHWGKSFLSKVA